MTWPKSAIAAVVGTVIVLYGCGSSKPDASGADAIGSSTSSASTTSTSIARTAESSTTSSSTTSTSTSTTTSPTSTGIATDDHPRRATGSGIATVDGEMFTYEVYACGWVISAVDPAHPGGEYAGELVFAAEPGDHLNFDMYGIDEQPDGRLFSIVVSSKFGTVVGAVTIGRRNAPDSVLHFAGGLNDASTLTIADGRLTTNQPITVGQVGESVQVEVDATCDSFGGSEATLTEVSAEIVDIELAVGSGSLTIDSVEYEIASTEICVTFEDSGEFTGTVAGADTEFAVSVVDDRAQQVIQISLSPERYLLGFGGAGEFFSVRDGRIATSTPISLERTDGEFNIVAFDLTC